MKNCVICLMESSTPPLLQIRDENFLPNIFPVLEKYFMLLESALRSTENFSWIYFMHLKTKILKTFFAVFPDKNVTIFVSDRSKETPYKYLFFNHIKRTRKLKTFCFACSTKKAQGKVFWVYFQWTKNLIEDEKISLLFRSETFACKVFPMSFEIFLVRNERF